jgi:DNA-binding transcriptional regulator/RsmH inhibitor MraZ
MKLRGNSPAKVDEKGRLKIPAQFLEALKEYGNQFYITSKTGEVALIYPLKVWGEIEDKLAKMPAAGIEGSGTNERRRGRFWEAGLLGSDESHEGA